jgi:hypothetical protein
VNEGSLIPLDEKRIKAEGVTLLRVPKCETGYCQVQKQKHAVFSSSHLVDTIRAIAKET